MANPRGLRRHHGASGRVRRLPLPVTDLTCRKYLVTGAASGIGRATAVMAGRAGADLFLTDIQEAALEVVVAEITGCPGAVDTPLVESVDIVGIDRNAPAARKLTADFRRRAVTPEHVAAAILEGIRKDRYLVFTSNDIRALFWMQRTVPPLYALLMRILNDRMFTVARRSPR